MKLFAIVLCTFVATALAATGKSYCNTGACSDTVACDLGICCTSAHAPVGAGEDGTCQDPSGFTVLAKDADCNACNNNCPSGQYCDSFTSHKCVDLPAPAACKNSLDCDCGADGDCVSGSCLNGKCAAANLGAGDACVENSQCTSKNCTAGACLGTQEGGSCFAAFSSCAPGLFCAPGAFGLGSCAQGAHAGASCNDTFGCVDPYTSCLGGKCVLQDTVASGDACGATTDCQAGLACVNGTCAAHTGNCNAADCGTSEGCYCDGTTGTKCVQDENVCATEGAAFITCLKTNGCPAPAFGFYGMTAKSCIAAHCAAETAALVCCQNCGDHGLGAANIPAFGVDCVAKTWTMPKYCGSPPAECPSVVSTCPPTTTGVATTGVATTGAAGSGQTTTAGGSGVTGAGSTSAAGGSGATAAGTASATAGATARASTTAKAPTPTPPAPAPDNGAGSLSVAFALLATLAVALLF